MGTTLNLSECLLSMGREMQSQGRIRDALKLFGRLVTFRDLSAAVSEEARARLADLLLADKQFAKARRLLSVLMCSQPNQGRYFYRYARALHRDHKADPHRAVKYYQQALDLDPAQPRWWSAYGKLLCEIGRTPDAVAAHRRAYELAGDDPAILARLVEAMCLDDMSEEARQLIREVRFRHPHDARFRKLWNDFQFSQLLASQAGPEPVGPVLLPFVRRAALPVAPRGPRAILKLEDARPPMPVTQRPSSARRDTR
ncbi:MAG: tetratricopeptide repeat protein [Gemmataceae bacterium]